MWPIWVARSTMGLVVGALAAALLSPQYPAARAQTAVTDSILRERYCALEELSQWILSSESQTDVHLFLGADILGDALREVFGTTLQIGPANATVLDVNLAFFDGNAFITLKIEIEDLVPTLITAAIRWEIAEDEDGLSQLRAFPKVIEVTPVINSVSVPTEVTNWVAGLVAPLLDKALLFVIDTKNNIALQLPKIDEVRRTPLGEGAVDIRYTFDPEDITLNLEFQKIVPTEEGLLVFASVAYSSSQSQLFECNSDSPELLTSEVKQLEQTVASLLQAHRGDPGKVGISFAPSAIRFAMEAFNNLPSSSRTLRVQSVQRHGQIRNEMSSGVFGAQGWFIELNSNDALTGSMTISDLVVQDITRVGIGICSFSKGSCGRPDSWTCRPRNWRRHRSSRAGAAAVARQRLWSFIDRC